MSTDAVKKAGDETASYEQYMTRVKKETIPAYEPSLGAAELVMLQDVIQRNWLSEGKYVREFESRLAKMCERSHALAFCNATSAMMAGMKAIGIGAGDEVIVPSFTHPADPNCVAAIGATPVFADVDEDALCLSVETIDQAKTAKTKAILYVSLYGNTSQLDDVAAYAKQYGLKLINDCAPALRGTFKGRSIASYGDFAALSFFADKTITTGEGGMLLTDDVSLINETNIYKHDGRRERGHDLVERIGYNFRITELQAAVGVAQLERLEEFVRRKQENQALYLRALSDVPQVQVFQFNPDCVAVPHRTLIFVPAAAPLIRHLSALGIGVRSTFMPMHSQPCYATGQHFPAAERLHARGVCLPSAPKLTGEQIDFICGAIKAYYRTPEAAS